MNAVIKKYLADGEGQRLDYKQTVSSASKIAKTIVSFANTRGGTLLIGIRDNKTISGINSEEEKYMLDLAGSFYCRPEVSMVIHEHVIDGKYILEVQIPNGLNKPYYAKDEEGKWWVYIRTGDKSLLASKTTVDFLHRKFGNESTKISMGKLEKGILDFLIDNEKTTLAQICKKFNIGRRRASNILVDLMAVDLVRSYNTEKVEFYAAVQ